MKISIQTVGFKGSSRLNQFVDSKVSKLFKQNPEILRADVTLKAVSSKDVENKWCSLYVSHRGENQYVKRKSSNYEESVLACVEAMEKIFRRLKTKKVNQRNDLR